MSDIQKIYASNGYEVWAKYDKSAELYELFTDKDGVGYVGCSDTLEEADVIAKDWVQEQMSTR